MKITKQLAEQITTSLLEKKQNEIDKKLENKKDEISNYLNSLAPAEIIKLNKKYPEYFKKETYIREETNYNSISLNKSVFAPFNRSLTSQQYKEYRTILDLQDDLNTLKAKTQSSIIACRTTKNLEVMFPEAIPFIPKQLVTNQIAINFKDLFSEIQDFPKEIKKETKQEKIAKVKAANKLEVESRKIVLDVNATDTFEF